MRQELSCRMSRSITPRYRTSDSMKYTHVVNFSTFKLKKQQNGIKNWCVPMFYKVAQTLFVWRLMNSVCNKMWQNMKMMGCGYILTLGVLNPVRHAACFSACLPVDIRINSCGKSSFRWRGQTRRSRVWDTLVPANGLESGICPLLDSRRDCKEESDRRALV